MERKTNHIHAMVQLQLKERKHYKQLELWLRLPLLLRHVLVLSSDMQTSREKSQNGIHLHRHQHLLDGFQTPIQCLNSFKFHVLGVQDIEEATPKGAGANADKFFILAIYQTLPLISIFSDTSWLNARDWRPLKETIKLGIHNWIYKS